MGRLIFVGLGLTSEDITPAARAAIDSADELVAEYYTSRLIGVDPRGLARLFDRPIRFLARREVEEEADLIVEAAKHGTVAFLTGGDAMTATTHADLRFRAEKAGVETKLVHGVSIQTAAAGDVGLHSYKFGRTTTLVLPDGEYLPQSPYEVVVANMRQGLHSLVLLDLRADEGRFMRTHEAAQILLRIARKRGEQELGAPTIAVACARIGSPDRRIVCDTLVRLSTVDLGDPLHCLIVPGKLHFTEEDALEHWKRRGR